MLDLSGLDGISVADDGVATIGAGARLGQVYAALHAYGRTLPAGCGATVGIAGLTLGGGIGLLGRQHGLTCDRLVGAQVVLADGSVVDCDHDHEPDLFWASARRGRRPVRRGHVTAVRHRRRADDHPHRGALVRTSPSRSWSSAWQAWAPDAPDELTVNLTLVSEPGAPVRATLFGAATLEEGRDPGAAAGVHRSGGRGPHGRAARRPAVPPAEEHLRRPARTRPNAPCGSGRSSSPARWPTAPSRRC